MLVTLSTNEFNEAVSCWLTAQGFDISKYVIDTRVIAGRSDGPLGTRAEVTLNPKDIVPVVPTYGFTSGGPSVIAKTAGYAVNEAPSTLGNTVSNTTSIVDGGPRSLFSTES